MNSTLPKICLTLLSVVILFGCQHSSSTPTSEANQSAKRQIDNQHRSEPPIPAAKELVPVDLSKVAIGTYKDVQRVNYDQIQIDMRFEKVVALLGPAFEVLSEAKAPDGIGKIEKIKWDQQWTDGFCVITFQANEVIAKEQTNLE